MMSGSTRFESALDCRYPLISHANLRIGVKAGRPFLSHLKALHLVALMGSSTSAYMSAKSSLAT